MAEGRRVMEPVTLDFRAERPVYWLIVVHDQNGKVAQTRWAWERHNTPAEATQDAYGIEPSPGMKCYPLHHTLRESRKMANRIAQGLDWGRLR